MENLQNEIREKALSDAKWRQIQQDLNQSVSLTIKLFIFYEYRKYALSISEYCLFINFYTSILLFPLASQMSTIL